MSQFDPPRVFISYSWDDDYHRSRVLALAQQLRRDGVDAWIDQFTPFATQGWDAWMRDEIARANFVLCVITKNYADRFVSGTPPSVGRGVKWEGSIITDSIYNSDGNEKFIPIFFDSAEAPRTPYPLSKHVDTGNVLPAGYDSIYRLVTAQPKVVPAQIGQRVSLPPKPAADPLSQPKVYRHRRNLGNLPRLLYFFGREDLLEAIDAALQLASRTWLVLIDGPGGVGKTTLAIRAAELASEDDYPRIVFVSAKVRELQSDGVRAIRDFLINSYLDLLNSIARELGDDTIAKLTEGERPAALLRLLREKPALLVLDNLESLPTDDMDRLVEFLERLPQDTKAIITSRRRQGLQAMNIRVDRLHRSAAADLLVQMAKQYPLLGNANQEELEALYQSTGGNPLLLRWAVSQLGLGRGKCRTIQSTIELLRESPAGLAALEYVFGDLIDTFTDEEMKVLASLTYFTQPVSVEHIAELADVGANLTGTTLEGLTERSIVVSDTELRHFVLTPLVADFIRRQKPELVRQKGDQIANSIYALTVENGFNRYSRFHVLEEAWSMIEAGLPVLDYDKLQTVCDALANFLGYAGRWDESIALNRLAEEKAVAQKQFGRAGWCACQQAYVMFLRGNAEGVRAGADRAAQYWQNITPTPFDLGILSRRRGMAYELQGDYSGAHAAYSKTLELWRLSSGREEYVARVLNDIAGIERTLKDYEAADRNYHEALRIAEKTDFVEGVINYTGNLADLALDREDWSRADALARKAFKLAKKMRHRELLAANSRRLAAALVRQGRALEAMRFASLAVEIFTALRSPNLAKAQETLSELEAILGPEGVKYVVQEIFKEEEVELQADMEFGDRLTEGRALYELGLLFQNQGRHKDAEKKFREALVIWQDSGKTAEQAKTGNSLGWTLQKQRRWIDAEKCYQQALNISKQINDSGEQWRSEENLRGLSQERALALANGSASAPAQAIDEKQFEAEVQAYEDEDASARPHEGGVLFYGSSSIRFWETMEKDFPEHPVINRGFGGGTLKDCVRLYDRLVKPYSPLVIILYAGDNDLANGESPQNIAGYLTEFLDLLYKDFPSTQVAFISIKPSPARQLLDDIEETNRLIEELASKRENLTFLDVYHRMLKTREYPNEDLFLDDRLHMSPAGYQIWKEEVTSYLANVWPQPAQSV
jgi:tetratricopeptide (TPR) repeat protein